MLHNLAGCAFVAALGIFVAALFVNTAAQAQSHEHEIKEQFVALCSMTANAAIEKLRPSLGDHAELAAKDDLVQVVEAADFGGFADYEFRLVLIPVMWCVETWYVLEAYDALNRQPRLARKVKAYIRYLNERQIAAQRAGAIDSLKIENFYSHASVKPAALQPAEQDQRHAAMENVMIDAMAFVIGHEIGHLALGHRPYREVTPAQSRQQEANADAFAVSLLRRANVSMIPAMFTLQRFFEGQAALSTAGASGRTHPRPDCRLLAVALNDDELDELLQDPTLRENFEAVSGQSATQLHQLRNQLADDCSGSP